MNQQSISSEAAVAAIKSSPPMAVATTSLAGIDWQQWVLIATFVYTMLLIVQFLFRAFRGLFEEKRDEDA